MPLFKKLNYGRILFEALRSYYSVNWEHRITILYKYCAALIFPLVGAFKDYDKFRRVAEVIANCEFVIGKLTNTLNFLFDPDQKRIYITQAIQVAVSAPEFLYPTNVNKGEFTEGSIQVREFKDKSGGSLVRINVPFGIDLAEVVAVVEQIKIDGVDYQIIEF